MPKNEALFLGRNPLGALGFPHSGCVSCYPTPSYKNLKNPLIEEASLPSGKVRWQWKVRPPPFFSKGKYISKWRPFSIPMWVYWSVYDRKSFKKHDSVQATSWKSPFEFQTRLRKFLRRAKFYTPQKSNNIGMFAPRTLFGVYVIIANSPEVKNPVSKVHVSWEDRGVLLEAWSLQGSAVAPKLWSHPTSLSK